MASRLSRTLFAQVARPAARASTRNVGRRMMSSAPHGSAPSSDTPWIIGSALVFGPLAAYLLTPPAKSKAHNTVEHSLPKVKEAHPEDAPVPEPEALPVTDDEGTQVPASEVASSVQAAANEDSPKDAQAAEEGKGKTPSEAAEGAPKEEGTHDAPAPAADNEPSDTPTEKHTGTVQSGEDAGPTNIGDARAEATEGKAPKEAAAEK